MSNLLNDQAFIIVLLLVGIYESNKKKSKQFIYTAMIQNKNSWEKINH